MKRKNSRKRVTRLVTLLSCCFAMSLGHAEDIEAKKVLDKVECDCTV
ncbi:MAG: hypothetical protein ACI8UP_005287 [Porticoccaceae bacterium]|jgi:hypothetical protein